MPLDEFAMFMGELKADEVVRETHPDEQRCIGQNIGAYRSPILFKEEVFPQEVPLTKEENSNLYTLNEIYVGCTPERFDFDEISKMPEYETIINWYYTKFLPVFNKVSENGQEPVFIKGSSMSMKDVMFQETYAEAKEILSKEYEREGRYLDDQDLDTETEIRTFAHQLEKITDPKIAFGYIVRSGRILDTTKAYRDHSIEMAFYIMPFDDSFDINQEFRSFVFAENGDAAPSVNATSSYMSRTQRQKAKLLPVNHPYALAITQAVSDYLKEQLAPDFVAKKDPFLKEVMGDTLILREDVMLRVRPTLQLLKRYLNPPPILAILKAYLDENVVMDLCIEGDPMQFLDEKAEKGFKIRFIELNPFPARPEAFMINVFDKHDMGDAILKGDLQPHTIALLQQWKEALARMIITARNKSRSELENGLQPLADLEKTQASLLVILGEQPCHEDDIQAHREIVKEASKKILNADVDGNFINYYNDAKLLYKSLKPSETPIPRISEHTMVWAYKRAMEKQGKKPVHSDIDKLVALGEQSNKRNKFKIQKIG